MLGRWQTKLLAEVVVNFLATGGQICSAINYLFSYPLIMYEAM
jgi:hypothetical protein